MTILSIYMYLHATHTRHRYNSESTQKIEISDITIVLFIAEDNATGASNFLLMHCGLAPSTNRYTESDRR